MIAPAQLSMIAVKRLIAGDGISDLSAGGRATSQHQPQQWLRHVLCWREMLSCRPTTLLARAEEVIE